MTAKTDEQTRACAEQALALDEHNFDARHILLDQALRQDDDDDVARDTHMQQCVELGLEASEVLVESAAFKEHPGDAWGDVTVRPLMRAMDQGIKAAWLCDRIEAGAALAATLLDADHIDQFGVAPRAAAASLALGDLEGARHFMARAVLEPITQWLLAIERGIAGDALAAQIALQDLCEQDAELSSALFAALAAMAGQGVLTTQTLPDINADIGTILLAAGRHQGAMDLVLSALAAQHLPTSLDD